MNLTTILLVSGFLATAFFVYKTFFVKKKKRTQQTPENSEAAKHNVHFSDSDDSDSDSDSDSDNEVQEREFTLEELHQYNGVANKEIYLSVGGVVFDVTHTEFYKPEGPYHCFAGQEATINLVESTFETSTLNKVDISDKPASFKQEMEDKVDFYGMKYSRVGWVKEWKEANEQKSDEEKKND